MLVEALRSRGVRASSVAVVDANDIDREVHKHNPTLVIIEAFWVTAAKMREIMSLHHHKQRKWVVRSHSKIPFLATEGVAVDWMLDYAELGKQFPLTLSSNSLEPTHTFSQLIDAQVGHLPNIYYKEHVPCNYTPDPTTLHVGCFGALRILKNQLQQACAAIVWAKQQAIPMSFHINHTRQEGPDANTVYKSLRALFAHTPSATLVEHAWLSHDHFLRLVGCMDVVMQVSYTETFNIVAADAAHMRVPLVVSPEISWVPREFHCDPNSNEDIVEALDRVVNHYAPGIVEIKNEWALAKYNEAAYTIWEHYLFDALH
jgi:hypothetical protein